MELSRRGALALSAAALTSGRTARAQAQTIRLGVLSDMSGPHRDTGGPNCVVMARQAAQDFGAAARDLLVEILEADHQNKPEVGVGVARQWFDRDGVDAILEVNNSAVALAINGLAREKNKVHLNSGAVSADLTGPACSPNTVHWATDAWAVAQSTAGALARAGATHWFLITADHAFGHSMQREVTRAVRAAGGQVVGAAVYPVPRTTDFSPFLISAAVAQPDAVGFCNAGADMINCVKQAHEFGLARRGIRLAAMCCSIADVHALGLPSARGLVLTESFYWDLNDRTRALHERLRGKLPNDHPPTGVQAQAYGAAFQYLRAVEALGAARAKASGLETVQAMKLLPTDDDAHGAGSVRADGRKLHPTCLFQVKSPAESHGPWDYFKLVATTPAERAFRPLAEGKCPFAKA